MSFNLKDDYRLGRISDYVNCRRLGTRSADSLEKRSNEGDPVFLSVLLLLLHNNLILIPQLKRATVSAIRSSWFRFLRSILSSLFCDVCYVAVVQNARALHSSLLKTLKSIDVF